MVVLNATYGPQGRAAPVLFTGQVAVCGSLLQCFVRCGAVWCSVVFVVYFVAGFRVT